MKKEYFEKGGKYGRVYIFPDKISIKKVPLPSKKFLLTEIEHSDIKENRRKYSNIQDHLMEENFSVVCGTFDSYQKHLDIFKCFSINIYGDLTHHVKIQNKVRKYMVKVNEVAHPAP